MTPAEAAELNLAVAKVEGLAIWEADINGKVLINIGTHSHYTLEKYEPITNGNQVVALMEKYKMDIIWQPHKPGWMALIGTEIRKEPIYPTIGEAVCRCVCKIHATPTEAS